MVKEFYDAVGVNNFIQLVTIPGRLYFGFNLIQVRILDWLKGTDFSGGKSGRLLQNEIGISNKRGNDYSPTPKCLIKTLKSLYITREDAIMDMGCGKGLAMFYMSRFPFSQIAGIELSKSLASSAKKNLRKLFNDNRRFRIICNDAGKWQHYEEYNFFYIYNSFPRQVIKEVLQRINESIKRAPRKVVILYLYPEFPDEFRRDGNFVLVKKGNEKEIRNGMHIYVNKEYRNRRIFK